MTGLGLSATFEYPPEQLDAAEQALTEGSTDFESERLAPPGEYELALGESIELKLKLGNTSLKYKITLVKLNENSPEIVVPTTVDDIIPKDPITLMPFELGEIVLHVIRSDWVEDPEALPDTYKLESFEYITDQKISPKLE